MLSVIHPITKASNLYNQEVQRMAAKQTLGGYTGNILRVNLSSHSTSVESLDELILRRYLGGAGFVAYYLWKELKQGTDPLSPDNKLIFALGPVSGINLAGASRVCIGSKSPLTGGIAKSEVGEFWPTWLKRAGFDAIIVEGKAEKPVYLWINNDEIAIKDASHLWGKDTKVTQDTIRNDLGNEKVRVAMIGPGGENQVLYACIMCGLFDAAGRGGLGAVMGSKNLKAVAVFGSKPPTIAYPDKLKAIRDWWLANWKPSVKAAFADYGTGINMKVFETIGNLPIRNFRDGLFPSVHKITPQAIAETYRIGMDACYACPVRCKKVVKIEQPYQVDPAFGGPEYETLAALGSNCGIDDLAAICMGNQLCAEYGIDTISTGGTLAFAMECFEKGLLTIKDTDGIDLRFGNAEAMLKVIALISERRGIGELLSLGSRKVAEKIGQGSEKFAIHVKGLECGFHDPRLKAALGFGFMVNPHGGDHVDPPQDLNYVSEPQIKDLKPMGILEPMPSDEMSPRKIALFRALHQKHIYIDSLVMCMIPCLPFSHQHLSDIVSAVTGWNSGVAEQMQVAERILTTSRLFNYRDGLSSKEDWLPQRFFESKTDGPLAEPDKGLDPERYRQALRYYYALMGWDPSTGVPLPEKIEELDIRISHCELKQEIPNNNG